MTKYKLYDHQGRRIGTAQEADDNADLYVFFGIIAVGLALVLGLIGGLVWGGAHLVSGLTRAIIPYTEVQLSDGRRQDFKTRADRLGIETKWEYDVPGGDWTNWQEISFPPTTARVDDLSSAVKGAIAYLYVDTKNGDRWTMNKLTKDPNSGWTPWRRTTRPSDH